MTCAAYGQHRIGDFMVYSANNGLPASLYYAVCQSSDGYLWIGSSSGLVRFDGERYKIYTSDYTDTLSISDNVITDIMEDDEENLWMAGLYHGVSKYNLCTGQIQRYNRLSPQNNSTFGASKILKDREGQIWIGTLGCGIAQYNQLRDSFEFLLLDPHKPPAGAAGAIQAPRYVSDIATDPRDDHILWLSCFDGLYSFQTERRTFERFEYYAPEMRDSTLPFLAIDTDMHDKIWLGTWHNGLISFDKRTHTFTNYPYTEADPQNSIYYTVLDIKSINDSTLYLAAHNAGLLSFHSGTHEIRPLLTNEMLPDGSSGIDIQKISLTPDAGIFVGGNYYLYQQHLAFNRFSHSISLAYGPGFGMNQMVFDQHRSGYWAACIDAGEMIFFTKDMTHQKAYPSQNEKDVHFLDVALDKNNAVWAISYSYGLQKWDEQDGLFKNAGNEFPGADTIARQILSIETDQDGNLWFLSAKQLFHLDAETKILQILDFLPTTKSALQGVILCSGLHHDAWVASEQGLFHCLANEHKVKHIVPDKENKSIANADIKSLTVDHEGNAWIGFESDGIQIVSAADHRILSTFSLKDGLPGMQINQLSTDTFGRIWVGTSAGLAMFNPKAGESVWQLFNREDGIKRDYIDRPIVTTADGKLFLNLDKGLSWIDLTDDRFLADHKPILHLVSLVVDGVDYQKDQLPEFLTSVELPYSVKEIYIEYAAMDWLHPFRTKYFYRIEGITQQGDWIENNQPVLTLTGMKPREYLFKAYAISGDGIRSEVMTLPILIRPPFWQQWWFISFCSISVLSLGYAIYRYRIGQFKKLQDMRNTISTNLHDDIGASLSNIHILTVLTQRNISKTVEATSYISKAGEEIQRISESLSDIVWNINPKYDDLDQLFIRMKRYSAEMFEGKNIEAELNFPDAIEKISMPMDQRRDFYLIFKEAVNNLVKYSEATKATVMVTTDHHKIRLEITDDGLGFNQDTLQYGNGMENMKQRAEKWKAVLQVTSEPGKGTTIVLDMKVS